MLITDPKQRGILVVDDERGPRESMRFLLKNRNYTNLHFAEHGLIALAKLGELGPAVYLVLLDIRMPRMDGWGVLEKAATQTEHPTGVIVVTGHPSLEGEETLKTPFPGNIRSMGYIGKPYEMLEMLERIESSLD